MKLKIFSESSYLPSEASYIPMLHPFLGEPALEKNTDINLHLGRFSSYQEIAHILFEISSVSESDLIIFPCSWEIYKYESALKELNDKSKNFKKPMIVFLGGDLPKDIPVEEAYIFHTSLYKSQKRTNDFAMPVFIDDLVHKNFSDSLPIRNKNSKPTVGFCGIAPPLNMAFGKQKLKESVRLALDHLKIHPFSTYQSGHSKRVKALLHCSKGSLVNTNFIIKSFSPMKYAYGYLMPEDKMNIEKHRQDFLLNMTNSDYIICARGWGNYSIRLYETLCCGRIPVFVDTDCVLPYDFKVNWKDYCIWVNEDEIHLIADKIVDFHDKISPKSFVELQHECRKLWKTWLSPEGFFSNFYQHFSFMIN